MSQTLIQDYITLAAASRIDRVRTVLTLAAFGVSGVVWDGVSKIVKQYNYSAGVPFYITEIPDKPSDLNFGLAIRYRVGSDVTRYKLWDVDGVDYAGEIYNGQVIKGNFVLEVWNKDSEIDATLSEDVVFETGIRSVPSDLRGTGDLEIATPTEVGYAELLPTNSFTPVVLSSIASLRQWLVADDLASLPGIPVYVDSWGDRKQGSQWVQSDAAKQPLCYINSAINNGKKYVEFDGVNDYLLADSVMTDIGADSTIYMVVDQLTWTLLRVLFQAKRNGIGSDLLNVLQSAATPELTATQDDVTPVVNGATLGSFCVIRIRKNAATLAIQVNEDAESVVVQAASFNTGGTFSLGATAAGTLFSNIRVANLAIFAADTAVSGQDEAIKAYFYSTYNIMGGVITPLPVYSESSYWLDND